TQIASFPLRALWRLTAKPIYDRLFRRYFQAMLDRLDSTLGELHDLRSEMSTTRAEVAELRALHTQLDQHTRTILASHWDTAALARRLVMLEDQLVASPTALEGSEPPRSSDFNGGEDRAGVHADESSTE